MMRKVVMACATAVLTAASTDAVEVKFTGSGRDHLLDYVNSISQAGDKLVESVLGERASGESGAEIIAKLTDMVNMDLHFINQCRQRLSQNKAEIERLGAAALEKKRAADAARSEALTAFEEERKQGEPTGEPADEGIRQANAAYHSQIDLLVKQLEKTTDEEKKKDLETAIAQVDADKTSYNQQLLANLDAAFREWYNACLAEYTSWTNSDHRLLKGERLSRSAADLLNGWLSYDVSEGDGLRERRGEARLYGGRVQQGEEDDGVREEPRRERGDRDARAAEGQEGSAVRRPRLRPRLRERQVDGRRRGTDVPRRDAFGRRRSVG